MLLTILLSLVACYLYVGIYIVVRLVREDRKAGVVVSMWRVDPIGELLGYLTVLFGWPFIWWFWKPK